MTDATTGGCIGLIPEAMAAIGPQLGEALSQLTSYAISANAPSMSRLLNAEYACSIMVLVSAIDPPTTLAIHPLSPSGQFISSLVNAQL